MHRALSRLATFAPVAVLFVAVTPYFGGIHNPNELVRVYMTVAMVEQGTFQIERIEERWGWVNDKARANGHVTSSKAPGTSFLGAPVHALHRALARTLGHTPDLREIVVVLRLGAVVLPTLVFHWFFLGWCERRAPPHLARAVFHSVAVGSLLYGYGITFVSHTLNAICAFGAVMALESAAEPGSRGHLRAALAGLLCASATMFEYPAAIASAAVAVWAVVRLGRQGLRGRLACFAAGLVPPAAATMAFHAAAFGDPFATGYGFLDNPTFRSNIARGFFGASVPSAAAFVRLLADPAFGLFVGTPILLFAFPGIRRALRERRGETIVALVVSLAMAVFVSSLNNWRGGWTVGPRYLSTIVPFLAGPALAGLVALDRRSATAASVLGGAATLLGLVLSGIPSALYPHVPEAFDFPLSQLFVPLLRDGRAPWTVLALAGVVGLPSLVPAAIAMVTAAVRSTRLPDLGFAVGLAGAVLALAITLAPPRPQQAGARALIERHWEPMP